MSKNCSIYEDYTKVLTALCKKRRFRLQKIGAVGRKKKYPIFALVFNNYTKAVRAVCFVGGLHGEEPVGPLALLKFLKIFQPQKYSQTKIIILPVANPTGFDRGERQNFLGRDINRHFFDKKLTAENKIIADFFKKEKIDILHTLHEDFERKKFYLWILENQESGAAEKIIKLAKHFFPIDKRPFLEGCVAKGGVISFAANKKSKTMTTEASLENWAFQRGVPFVLATETPAQVNLSKRINFYLKALELLL